MKNILNKALNFILFLLNRSKLLCIWMLGLICIAVIRIELAGSYIILSGVVAVLWYGFLIVCKRADRWSKKY